MWKKLQQYWHILTLEESQPNPSEASPRLAPKPGRVAGDSESTTLPMTLHQLVQVSRVDVGQRLKERIESGYLANTIGIGEHADITLLDDDLLAAAVTTVDRNVEIVTVTLHPGQGWSAARGDANFGVYHDSEFGFTQLHRRSQIDDLVPGDRIGMGSCPADALWFQLPEIRGIRIPQRVRRSPAGQRKLTYQATLRAALLHWNYDVITLGSDEACVVRVRDPDLAGLSIQLSRTLEDPSRGLTLEVTGRRIPVLRSVRGSDRFEPVEPGESVVLHGGENRLRFGTDQQVHLPAPCTPIGRFDGRISPTTPDIIAVLGLDSTDLQDSGVVKHRYRELVRVLHPDRNPDNEGHKSRFLEVQACWKVYREVYG